VEKRKRWTLEIPPSERLVMQHTATDHDEVEFSANIARVAKTHLTLHVIHFAEAAVSVTAEGLKRRKIKIVHKGSKSNLSTSGFAYAWADRDVDDFIYIDMSFLFRWKKASIKERRRIEMLIVWKIIHELAHSRQAWG
jgi:hypothetical protein